MHGSNMSNIKDMSQSFERRELKKANLGTNSTYFKVKIKESPSTTYTILEARDFPYKNHPGFMGLACHIFDLGIKICRIQQFPRMVTWGDCNFLFFHAIFKNLFLKMSALISSIETIKHSRRTSRC